MERIFKRSFHCTLFHYKPNKIPQTQIWNCRIRRQINNSKRDTMSAWLSSLTQSWSNFFKAFQYLKNKYLPCPKINILQVDCNTPKKLLLSGLLSYSRQQADANQFGQTLNEWKMLLEGESNRWTDTLHNMKEKFMNSHMIPYSHFYEIFHFNSKICPCRQMMEKVNERGHSTTTWTELF